MWCPSLATLREGLDIDNDQDVVQYFQKVVKYRESLGQGDQMKAAVAGEHIGKEARVVTYSWLVQIVVFTPVTPLLI